MAVSYSLDLSDSPTYSGEAYVPAHEFPDVVRRGDRFVYDGYTWQVVEVATKQMNAPGEPAETLRCRPL